MSVVTLTVLGNDGKSMNSSYEWISLDVSQEVNRISYARLVLLDGDAAQQEFPISDSDFFEPGNQIEMKLRYEETPDQEVTVFKGLVIKQNIEASLAGSLLTIELKDAAVKLTRTRKSQVYRDQTDDKIIAQIIDDSGLTKGTIPTTQVQHSELAQYYCSDWDFILSRADSLGLLVTTIDGEIALSEITIEGQPQHTFEYGINDIFSFEMEVNAEQQYPSVQSTAWDIKNQELTKPAEAKDFTLSQGNLQGADIAKAIGIESHILNNPISLEAEELQAWSDAIMAKTRMALIRGRICVPGDGNIKLLNIMELAGIGKRFNGKTLITGVRHHADQNSWVTDVQFGLSPERFAEQQAIVNTPAAGLLPAVNGLQVGVVSQFEADPAKEFRVKVILPSIGKGKEGAVWARVASLDAGKNRGYVFWPEVDDEVIVGFFNDDPRQAVILGAMYSSKNTPPDQVAPLAEENIEKAIVTKTGMSIKFIDDKKPALLIKTPNSNKIRLDEDAEMIQIIDQHSNGITLNKDGIEVKSTKDIKIEAQGNVEIKGQKVDVK